MSHVPFPNDAEDPYAPIHSTPTVFDFNSPPGSYFNSNSCLSTDLFVSYPGNPNTNEALMDVDLTYSRTSPNVRNTLNQYWLNAPNSSPLYTVSDSLVSQFSEAPHYPQAIPLNAPYYSYTHSATVALKPSARDMASLHDPDSEITGAQFLETTDTLASTPTSKDTHSTQSSHNVIPLSPHPQDHSVGSIGKVPIVSQPSSRPITVTNGQEKTPSQSMPTALKSEDRPKKLNWKLATSKIKYTFTLHLRSGERRWPTRRLTGPVTVTLSQLLTAAADIPWFTSARIADTVVSSDQKLSDIPIVQQQFIKFYESYGKDVVSQSDVPLSEPVIVAGAPEAFGQGPPASADDSDDDVSSDNRTETSKREDIGIPANSSVQQPVIPESASITNVKNELVIIFDVAVNVKSCTRLGCTNLLIKKSSRRSCEKCQANGFQLNPGQLRRICLRPPFDNFHTSPSLEYSALSPEEQEAIPGHLSILLDFALERIEHWRFSSESESGPPTLILALASEEIASLLDRALLYYLEVYREYSKGNSVESTMKNIASMTHVISLSSTGVNERLPSSMSRDYIMSSPATPVSTPPALSPEMEHSDSDTVRNSRFSCVEANEQSFSSSSRSADDGTSDSELDGSLRVPVNPALIARSNAHLAHQQATFPPQSIPSNSGSQIISFISSVSSKHILTALHGLFPNYPYLSHLGPVDPALVYHFRMKSHFWKLEAKGPAKKMAGGKLREKTQSFKKVGKTVQRKLPSKSKSASTLSLNLAAARSTTQSVTQTSPMPNSASSDMDKHTNPLSIATSAVRTSSPFNDSPTKRESVRFTARIAQEEYSSSSNTSTSLPDSELQPFESNTSSTSSILPLSRTNNCVLLDQHSFEDLKSAPVNAMLSVLNESDPHHPYSSYDQQMLTSQFAPVPVLLVYRDAETLRLDPLLRNVPNSGNDRDGDPTGRKDPSHGRRRDYDDDNDYGSNGRSQDSGAKNEGNKRRRINHPTNNRGLGLQLHFDESLGSPTEEKESLQINTAPRPEERTLRISSLESGDNTIRLSSTSRSSCESMESGGETIRITAEELKLQEPDDPNGDKDDPVGSKYHLQQNLLYDIVFGTPLHKRTFMQNFLIAQRSRIWTSFILLLGCISLILIALNFVPQHETFSLVKTVTDPYVFSLSRVQIIQDISSSVPSMRMASPIFDTWIKTFPTSGVVLQDDVVYNAVTDVVTYPVLTARSDVETQDDPSPNSVVHSMREATTVNDSTNPPTSSVIPYSELLEECQNAVTASKAISDWIAAANDLGRDYASLYTGASPASDDGLDPLSTRASGLLYPPNTQTICSSMSDVSLHYLVSVICHNLQDTPQLLFSPDVHNQCVAGAISDCVPFMEGIIQYNLTNVAFNMGSGSALTPLVASLTYRQQASELSTSCARVTNQIQNQLPYLQAIASKQEVNAPVLLFIVLGGSFIVLLLLALALIGYRFTHKLVRSKSAPSSAPNNHDNV